MYYMLFFKTNKESVLALSTTIFFTEQFCLNKLETPRMTVRTTTTKTTTTTTCGCFHFYK
jgi:hypothetical protein